MTIIQSLFSTALNKNAQALIVYFCGFRSTRFHNLIVKSLFADRIPVNLATNSCLLISGATNRINGQEVTHQCIQMNTKVARISGLLCRYTSPNPISKWAVEVCVSETFVSSRSNLVRFECTTNQKQESGSMSVPLGGPEDGELDVYYLVIRPTLEDGSKSNPAVGFPMRAVSSSPVSTSEVAMIGHRGVGAEQVEEPEETRWPENTIHAFQKAAELKLTMAECDVLPMRGSKDLAIYHNFNVKMKQVEGKPLHAGGYPLQELDLFDNPPMINRNVPNMLPTLSPEELQKLLKGTEHEPSCISTSNGFLQNGIRNDAYPSIQLSRSSPEAAYIPTFSQLLEHIPLELGLDVEVKYPAETPFSAFRLMNEHGETATSLQGYGYPCDYFYPINETVDNLLNLLRQRGNGRRVILSSFNPDICLAMKLKQSTYPVYLISRAGFHPVGCLDHPQSLDPRHESGQAAALWAHLLQLDGVVLFQAALNASDGVNSEEPRQLARLLASLQLAAFPYGAGVSSRKYRQFAASLGLTAVCIDNVVNLAKTEELTFP